MTREIRYVLMDPAGNRTILVDTAVPVADQPFVAAKLMELEPSAEQAGFLSVPDDRGIALRMAGGEFCGNAAMSAAVRYGIRAGLLQGQVVVRVSGEPEPVTVDIRRQAGGGWSGMVRMPRPLSVENIRFPEGSELPVIFFRGISHVILEQEMSEKEAEKLAKNWCGFLKADALGLMFLDRKKESLTPLVYVPAADTLFWENACGSGTAAVGAWLAQEHGEPVTASLRQPGGILEISAEPDGSLFLKGTVRCLYEKVVILE